MNLVIPPRAPNGLAEVIATYGDPKARIVGGEWIVDRAWEDANLTTLFHPFLPKGRIYLHRLILAPTRNVLNRWQARVAAGDPYRLRTFGCFQPRAQRGTRGLVVSMHTFAIAWDVNADTNPMIVDIDIDDPRRQTAKDIPDAWIADAKAEGLFYGGEFRHRFDPQHFQLATGC